MTKRPLKNVGASVRARLLARSRETGEDFQSLLWRYAVERFIFRLGRRGVDATDRVEPQAAKNAYNRQHLPTF